MTPIELLEYYGNTHRFHLETGMSHNSLISWLKMGYVPLGSQRKLERITNGLFKVRLKDLGDR